MSAYCLLPAFKHIVVALIERRLPHSFFSASAAHSAHTPLRIALPPTTVAIAPCHRRPPCPACSGIHASSVRRPTPPNPRRHFPRRHRLRPTLQLPRDAAAFSLSFVVHPITAIPRLLAAVAAPTPHTPTPVSSTPPQRIANGAVLSLLPRDDGGAAADRKAPDVKDAASRFRNNIQATEAAGDDILDEDILTSVVGACRSGNVVRVKWR
ncbi:hypothetical protein OsI_07151 [Oryza sativa Indica Group]|uniref:Uncharacterized protein n=1 Tax=Oryza sativa subsp. indica TaxID=39946 RepID=B8AHI7_ORYSI|nr:hypothetical protein OsI_07151 [Oryza sativa Indica Group]